MNSKISFIKVKKTIYLKSVFIIALCILFTGDIFAQVGISNTSITPDASSVLELRSTTTGFLPPRMTTTERDAIASPATGLLIYNTTTNQLNYYSGSLWQLVAGGTGVTSVSVTPANGISGSVANATTTPAISLSLGAITPSSIVATGTITGSNLSGTNTGDQTNITGNAATVTTNANLTGEVTSVGNATTVQNATVLGKVLTGYTSGAGVISATDNILQAIQKLNGNKATNANLTGPITSVGNTTSIASQTGTGTTFVMNTSPVLVTPTLGAATATTINGLTLTSNATGFSIAGGTTSKTLTTNNTLTLAGTDATTMTFPSTSATLARTDAANTFTGHQTIEGVTSTGATGTGKFVFDGAPTLVTPVLGVATATTINGLTLTSNASGFSIAGGTTSKTLTSNNTLTLAGTDATTMTFPTTSATLARTDAANTFTGHQTIEGVTSTGSTGTGKLVFDGTPTLVTPVLGIATATSINKVTLTAPATAATLTLANNSSLITSGAFATTITSSGATSVTLPTSGTLYGTATGSITSAQLATSLTDETGTGSAVLSSSPTFTGTVTMSGLTLVKGTVIQATSTTTGVTVNAAAGMITTFNETITRDGSVTFTVSNSFVTATSVINTTISDYAGTWGTNGIPIVSVSNIRSGAFDIIVFNGTYNAGRALSGALKIGFVVN